MTDDEIEKKLLRYLPHDPFQAMNLLPSIRSDSRRARLASSIASAWRQYDINVAWNAVAKSQLGAAEKQIIFNELWS
jgi:hypothetical protein